MKERFLLLFALFTVSLFGQQANIVLASDIWPPFTDKPGKKSVATAIVSEALNRLDVQSEIEITEFKNVIDGIEKNNFQGSAALWKTDSREQFLIYSEPYLQNQMILVGLKGSSPDAHSAEKLNGLRIGLVQGYAYKAEFLTNREVRVMYSESDQRNLEKLFDGEIDFMLVDDLLIHYLIQFQTNGVDELLEIGKKPISVQPLYFALSKDVDNAAGLIDQFNSEIKAMIKDGTYLEILELNWVRIDIDGDGKAELVLNGDKAGANKPDDSYAVFHDSVSDHDDAGFMIQGQKYDDWNQVPSQYKVDMTNETVDPGGTLKIDIGK